MNWAGILFLVTFSILTYGQDFEIKQITSGDFDVHNPAIKHNYFNYSNSVFFEIHKDSSVNIYYSSYDDFSDMFSDTIAVTAGKYKNINPVPLANGGIIFQTNQNGNWDIAYREFENGTFGEIIFLTSTPEDEINPREIFFGYPFFEQKTELIFERDGSIIYLYADTLQISEELVFEKTNELFYDQSAGVYSFGGIPPQQEGLHLAAIQKDQNGIDRIVSRHRNQNGTWDSINVVLDSCRCSNLIFQPVEFYPGLVYEQETDSNKILAGISDWEFSKTPVTLLESTQGDCSSFRGIVSYIITKPNVGSTNLLLYYPHSYFVSNSENTKIRLNYDEIGVWTFDSLYLLKTNHSRLTVGAMGFNSSYEVVYTIFEDSSDGRVHLFGRRNLSNLSSVNDEISPDDFSLYQNYPNPFNPKTKISWQTTVGSLQILKVYDVLGNEVATLMNEYKPAGIHGVEFDASKLSSGVYFYRLQVGDIFSSKKMLLLK